MCIMGVDTPHMFSGLYFFAQNGLKIDEAVL